MLTALIAYFLIQNQNHKMATDNNVTKPVEDCGCGGHATNQPCSCKKNKTIKIVITVVVIAALAGAAYWAYTKGYVATAIEKIKGLTTKTV